MKGLYVVGLYGRSRRRARAARAAARALRGASRTLLAVAGGECRGAARLGVPRPARRLAEGPGL